MEGRRRNRRWEAAAIVAIEVDDVRVEKGPKNLLYRTLLGPQAGDLPGVFGVFGSQGAVSLVQSAATDFCVTASAVLACVGAFGFQLCLPSRNCSSSTAVEMHPELLQHFPAVGTAELPRELGSIFCFQFLWTAFVPFRSLPCRYAARFVCLWLCGCQARCSWSSESNGVMVHLNALLGTLLDVVVILVTMAICAVGRGHRMFQPVAFKLFCFPNTRCSWSRFELGESRQ